MVGDRGKPEQLHGAHRRPVYRDHGAASFDERLHLHKRLRADLTLPPRELLGDRLRREARTTAARGAAAAALTAAATGPPGRRCDCGRLTRGVAAGGTAASTAAPSEAAAGLQSRSIEHEHVELVAQIALVEIRGEDAFVRELEVLEDRARPARGHVAVAVRVEEPDARRLELRDRAGRPDDAASKLTPRSAAIFSTSARVVGFAAT